MIKVGFTAQGPKGKINKILQVARANQKRINASLFQHRQSTALKVLKSQNLPCSGSKRRLCEWERMSGTDVPSLRRKQNPKLQTTKLALRPSGSSTRNPGDHRMKSIQSSDQDLEASLNQVTESSSSSSVGSNDPYEKKVESSLLRMARLAQEVDSHQGDKLTPLSPVPEVPNSSFYFAHNRI